MKSFSVFALFIFHYSLSCFSQNEFNIGINGGLYLNNTLANIQIHAYKNSHILKYSDPIKVHNRLIGLNFEYRNKIGDALTFVSSLNFQKSEFHGGGKDSTGFDEKMSFKFRYTYFQLMGFEMRFENDEHEVDLGLSIDLGWWNLKRKYIRAAEPNAEYLKSYGSYQLGYTWWLRYTPKSIADMQFLLSWHRAVISSSPKEFTEFPYEYKLKFLSLSVRYSINND